MLYLTISLKGHHEKTRLLRLCHPGNSAGFAGRQKYVLDKVGVAFSHNGKSGLNIVLTPGIAVSGKLVLLEPREDNNPPQSTVPGETAL